MTDKIIEMARKANLPACHSTHTKALERFAQLIRADERAKRHLPDVISNDYAENPEYVAGWNECREVMAGMMK